ncbi:TonB-dependent siderophore receptor [Silvibacterium dinghuense]|uniref:TonB-dependent siderophore receptor n=1 Tax=Silvibacterium dinghuense TaxID=1560006 RepID=A0A4Q1S8X9_9BACT|nr:TonB-dependent siderophore receptor [Silvibacterium dinghuense]RXS93343.1 TonB-dependent siderophore receptor [Silvibacterium dinghuense]GGH05052.1 TonB-dependent receptor [Silvibacterium dinghuense]
MAWSATITDHSGAVLPMASVELLCGAQQFAARSAGPGRFTANVVPGDYLLKVSAAGFAPIQQEIAVNAQAASLTLALDVQKASNTVTVQAEAGYVATDSGSAMKIDTPLLETPQSVDVITRELMDDQQPQYLNDALRYAAGVNAENEGTSSQFWTSNSIQLRGFTPGIFLDGLEEDPDGNTLLDAYFYQRIEVMAGPSSVLYGQASPGGIINVETKRPLSAPLREIELGFGSYGHNELNFDFSGPLATRKLLYRLTGVGFKEGSQTWFIDPQRVAIAPALTWIPDDRTSLTILTNYTYNPTVGAMANLPASGTVLYNPYGKVSPDFYLGDPNYNQTKQSFLELGDVFTRSFDHGWQLGQNYRFTSNKDHAQMIWPEELESDMQTLDRYTFDRHTTFTTSNSDQRVSEVWNTGKVTQTFLGGVNYTHFDEHWHWGSGDVESINIFHPKYYVPIVDPAITGSEVASSDQTGLYFQDQVSVGHLRASAGLRQDWYKVNEVASYGSINEDQSKLTWRTGASYLLGNGFAPYFSYTTSFEPDLSLGENSQPLPPTTGRQYEAGVKYQPAKQNMMLTAAIYDLAEQNVGTTDPNNPNFTIAVGEIRTRGVELSAHASLSHALSYTASYTHLKSLYAKSDTDDTGIDGVTRTTQDQYQYGVPLNMASLWFDYTLPTSLFCGFGGGAGGRFVGASWGDDVNSFKVPGVTLFDASAHYDLPSDMRWLRGTRFQFNATNLGDRNYVASCYSSTGCYPGLMRTLYGTMRYRW